MKIKSSKSGSSTARWLQVLPKVEGKLPSFSAEKESWLRMDTIIRIEKHLCIGVGNDSTKWEYAVVVHTASEQFFTNSELFSSFGADEEIDSLMRELTL